MLEREDGSNEVVYKITIVYIKLIAKKVVLVVNE